MDDLGHDYTVFYVCRKCGVTQHEANMGGIRCTEVDEADTPILVEAAPDG